MGTLATVLERLAIGGAIAALVAIPAANYLQELDALETVSDTLEAAQGDSWALILEDSNGETWALETGATLGDCLAAQDGLQDRLHRPGVQTLACERDPNGPAQEAAPGPVADLAAALTAQGCAMRQDGPDLWTLEGCE